MEKFFTLKIHFSDFYNVVKSSQEELKKYILMLFLFTFLCIHAIFANFAEKQHSKVFKDSVVVVVVVVVISKKQKSVVELFDPIFWLELLSKILKYSLFPSKMALNKLV